MNKNYHKEYYLKHKKKLIKKAKKWITTKLEQDNDYARRVKHKSKEKAKERNRQIVYNLKKENGCCLCGCKDWYCLEFDHLNPKDKTYLISRMIGYGYSKQTFMREIEKCQLLCRNCHRKKHTNNNYIRNSKAKYINDFKLTHNCVDCNESDHRCLEFHHLDTNDKELAISWMIRDPNYNLDDVVNEIQKCIVICGNCHIKRHPELWMKISNSTNL